MESAALADEPLLLASAYYSLFWVFYDWHQKVVGGSAPPGLVLRNMRSAHEEWPHGALLPAIICLLRSRRARIERLRSLRRWHMLYTSHTTMLPCSASHLSCLARARRSLNEWHFYSNLTRQVLFDAASELRRARLIHGIHQWHTASIAIDAHHELARKWGLFSLPRRAFVQWAQLVAQAGEIEAVAMRCALNWCHESGLLMIFRLTFRRLSAHARRRREIYRTAVSVTFPALPKPTSP